MFFVEIYKKNFFTIVPVILVSGFFRSEMVYAEPGACAAQVQGKIAWDYKGSKHWKQSNIDRLCFGAEHSTEPARCFNKVMHGGVNWGGGTRWQWQNAIDLCEASTNADATIGCFQREIKKGKSWKSAIKTCDSAANVKPASSHLNGPNLKKGVESHVDPKIRASSPLIGSNVKERVDPHVGPKIQIPVLPSLWFKLDNWGFELGLSGWEKLGTAFDTQPTYGDNIVASRVIGPSSRFKMPLGGDYWKGVAFPIGFKGNRWIGTFERKPKNSNFGRIQGDKPTGALTSKSFIIDKSYISFLIGGGNDPSRLTISLYIHSSDTPTASKCTPVTEKATSGPPQKLHCFDGTYRLVTGTAKTGFNTELMRRDWWNVKALHGKTARIRIDDQATGSWGHINVDDFRFEAVEPSRAPAPVGGPRIKMAVPYVFKPRVHGEVAALGFVDWDAPLWGVADLHTHPMSYLGFGKKLMSGRPDGDINTELANCNADHGGWGFDNTGGNYLRALIVNLVDKSYLRKGDADHPHNGAPSFTDWPHFSSATHQQMRWEWIKRANEGGLRVMVALAVNNQLLADAIDGVGAYTRATADKVSADEQIQAMKDFVAWVKRQPGGDFLDIVMDPAQLRQTVRQGKLAVVLGIEVDNIGDFNRIGIDRSETAVRAEIRRLYNNGVRYIFPVHVSDNIFGGAAIYEPLFNLTNRYAAVQPLPPEIGAWVPGTAFQIEPAPDPEINFRLEPLSPLPGTLMLQARGMLAGIEHLPTPFPNPCFPCPSDPISLLAQSGSCEAFKSTTGLRLNTIDPQVCGSPALEIRQMFQPKQYELITRFFLTPDPVTDSYALVRGGHRNRKGMTPLGVTAINEMMRLGMVIDIDHMSEKTAEKTIEIAEAVPDGDYPLVSGHTGFRAMQTHDVNENQRSDDQLSRISELGGMMGIGWGYSKDETGEQTKSFERVIATRGGRAWTTSHVNYERQLCAGTSRTFAQNYLYGIEKIGAVALGSDINGLIAQPGPRFGSLATAGGNRCERQNDATRVRYSGSASSGSGPTPLVPSTAGRRTYNINVDGMAHYGLLPDFLQDLSQVGVNPEDMTPLFRSADAFARTWTKAVEQSARVR